MNLGSRRLTSANWSTHPGGWSRGCRSNILDISQYASSASLHECLTEFLFPHKDSQPNLPSSTASLPWTIARHTLLRFDDAMAARLDATLLRDALGYLAKFDALIRSLGDDELEKLIAYLQSQDRKIRGQTRRADDADARKLLADMESRHRFTLVTESAEQERAVVDVINRARSKIIASWQAVLEGTSTFAAEMPPSERGLLLQSLTGASPHKCLEHWASIKGGERNLKTYDKFRDIADDLAAMLDGQCVEALTRDHVRLYADYLRARGNSLNTVHGKLSICLTLLSSCNLASDTRRAFADIRPAKARARQHSAPRQPFTLDQLGALLQGVFADTSLPADDRVIVALQALAGARLEEICSLTGPQLAWTGQHWTVDFVEADVLRKPSNRPMKQPRAEGLKCLDSVRTIPVNVSSIRGLHERLLALKKAAGKGRLFSHLTANRYGSFGSAVGKRLNKRIDQIVGEDRRLVLESLRNTAAPAMRRAGIDSDERRMFMGHAPVDIHGRHYDLPTTEDLLGASQAVSGMVAQALSGRDYPALDGQYRARRIRRSRNASGIATSTLPRHTVKQPSVLVDEREADGQLDSSHGLHQDVDGHVSIVAADLPVAVPGQGVMHILGDTSSSAQGLERVPERVEDKRPVGDTAALGMTQVAPPPFRPVPAALAESVHSQRGKQPLPTRSSEPIDVAPESNSEQLGMHRNHAYGRVILDSGSQAVRANMNQQPMDGVRLDVADAQLTQLFEAASSQKAERRQPSTGLSTRAPRSQSFPVYRRREDRVKLLRVERPSPDALPFLARHAKTAERVVFLETSVNGSLHDGAQVPELFGDRLRMQRGRKQGVPVSGHIPSTDTGRRQLGEGIESIGGRSKLDHGPLRAIRVELAPVLEECVEGLVLGHREGRGPTLQRRRRPRWRDTASALGH